MGEQKTKASHTTAATRAVPPTGTPVESPINIPPAATSDTVLEKISSIQLRKRPSEDSLQSAYDRDDRRDVEATLATLKELYEADYLKFESQYRAAEECVSKMM